MLERTSRENPKFAQPLLSLAAVYVQQKDMDGAAAAYAEGAGGRPRQRGGAARPRRRRAHPGRPRRGRDALRAGRGARRRRTPRRSRSSASCGCGRGRPPEAIALFRRAVESDPKNAEALLYLAGALASNGRAGRGRALLRARPRGGTRARRWRSTASASPGSSSGTGRARPRPSASRCASTRSSRTSPRPFGTSGRPYAPQPPGGRLDHDRLAGLGDRPGHEVGHDHDHLVASRAARRRAARRGCGPASRPGQAAAGVSGAAARTRPSLRRTAKPAVTLGLAGRRVLRRAVDLEPAVERPGGGEARAAPRAPGRAPLRRPRGGGRSGRGSRRGGRPRPGTSKSWVRLPTRPLFRSRATIFAW